MTRIVDHGPVVNLWLILFSLGVNTPVRLLNHATFGESKTVIGVTEENKRTIEQENNRAALEQENKDLSRVGKKTNEARKRHITKARRGANPVLY